MRNTIAALKEFVEEGVVQSIEWVPTTKQLADCMTKKDKIADWLLNISNQNILAVK